MSRWKPQQARCPSDLTDGGVVYCRARYRRRGMSGRNGAVQREVLERDFYGM